MPDSHRIFNKALFSMQGSSQGGEWTLYREIGERGVKFDWAFDVAARHPDQIAVTDYRGKRIVICSIHGNQKSTSPMQRCPLRIAAVRTDNSLLVLEHRASHVKVLNIDNTLVYKSPTVPLNEVGKIAVELQSIAVKEDDTIVVGDVERMVLTEHNPTDGELLRTIPAKIKPYFLAIDSNDRVVISGYKSDAVHVADGNGASLFTIPPSLNGQPVRYCGRVYIDESGVYVAVHNGCKTGHIHHYDTDQGGFLKCIAQGLERPGGFIFTSDGKLAVADC
ncbi:uncharacterized protein LOC119742204 isoform X2 [Patiria miniata]|uniref:Uncharacterized protein n=1 Tax=Patiria miniata TaxID=46514 RepID=A0A914BD65_PATMI|nr:uncharacterized protein LOC119742204 isoform X2 [Patiria miniata]